MWNIYIWCTSSGNFSKKNMFSRLIDLVGHWEIRIKQITQEYCFTRQNNIINLCESLRKDIDALAQKAHVNPEMVALSYTMKNVNN